MTAKTIRSVVEDCYKSREVIGGVDKWNELIDDALADIRAVMPSVSDFEQMLPMELSDEDAFRVARSLRKMIDLRLL